MSVTMEQVLSHLTREETNYQQAAALGEEALPHLLLLIEQDDPNLAARATYLAGFINLERSSEIISKAAQSADPSVRVAAAASIKNLTILPRNMAMKLLEDQDVGVRKWVLKSLEIQKKRAPLPNDLEARIRQISDSESDQTLRQLANQISLPSK